MSFRDLFGLQPPAREALKEHYGFGHSIVVGPEALSKILAGIEEDRLAFLRPMAKKSAKRRQRQTQKTKAHREVLLPE